MAIEQNVFDHILYEFNMYLKVSSCSSSDQFMNNLFVESRSVHLRNLAYFFSKKRRGNYMHYLDYIPNELPNDIDQKTYDSIQNITCNGVCHMQTGRLVPGFKQKALKTEVGYIPRMRELIKGFVLEMNQHPCLEYEQHWKDPVIQCRAKGILALIQSLERIVIIPVMTE